MSRRNHPHVDAMRAATTQTFELLLLQHPQQLRLQRQRNIPYLIEEQCPLVGHFETANFLRESSGESGGLLLSERARLFVLGCECRIKRSRRNVVEAVAD